MNIRGLWDFRTNTNRPRVFPVAPQVQGPGDPGLFNLLPLPSLELGWANGFFLPIWVWGRVDPQPSVQVCVYEWERVRVCVCEKVFYGQDWRGHYRSEFLLCLLDPYLAMPTLALRARVVPHLCGSVHGQLATGGVTSDANRAVRFWRWKRRWRGGTHLVVGLNFRGRCGPILSTPPQGPGGDRPPPPGHPCPCQSGWVGRPPRALRRCLIARTNIWCLHNCLSVCLSWKYKMKWRWLSVSSNVLVVSPPHVPRLEGRHL